MLQIKWGNIASEKVDGLVSFLTKDLKPASELDARIQADVSKKVHQELQDALEIGITIPTQLEAMQAAWVFYRFAEWLPFGEGEESEALIFRANENAVTSAKRNDWASFAIPALDCEGPGGHSELDLVAQMKGILSSLERIDTDMRVEILCSNQEDYDFYLETARDFDLNVLDQSGNPVNPPMPNCPTCKIPMSKIVYGLVMPGPGTEDLILGGCSIYPDMPTIGCKNCGLETRPEKLAHVSS